MSDKWHSGWYLGVSLQKSPSTDDNTNNTNSTNRLEEVSHEAVWLSHRRRWCVVGRKVCGAGTLASFWTVL